MTSMIYSVYINKKVLPDIWTGANPNQPNMTEKTYMYPDITHDDEIPSGS